MSKVLSNVKLKINSELCNTVGDSVEFDPGGMDNEPVIGDDKVHFREKPVHSNVSAKLLYTERTKLKMLNTLVEGTIEIVTNIGGNVVHTITSATRKGPPCKVGTDGTIAFEAFGDPIELAQ